MNETSCIHKVLHDAMQDSQQHRNELAPGTLHQMRTQPLQQDEGPGRSAPAGRMGTMKVRFQFIAEGKIAITEDNSQTGTLFGWVERIAGTLEAMNAQGWSEVCEPGEYYEGENFEIICLDE